MSNLSERTQAPIPYTVNHAHNFTKAASSFNHTAALFQGLPFDLAREQYAKAVQFGFVQRSMLASAKFAQQIDLLEKMTLGPWARRV
jgi:hypothetical protein